MLHQPQGAEDNILLPGKHIISDHRAVGSSSKPPRRVRRALYNIEVLSLSPSRDVQNRAIRIRSRF
jgi:hypothetical protein